MNKKIVFFGTPDFITDFLDVFERSGYTPALIVTNPDAPRGRGQILTAPAPKLWAERRNISVAQPERLDEIFLTDLSKQEWDLFIVIAYGKIIPEKFIHLPKHGTINLHYSLLPKYRGASPVEAALLHGDDETGICIQQMVYELDAGDILYSEKIKIEEDDTTGTLRERLNKRACEIFPNFLNNLFNGAVSAHPQKGEVSKTKKISKSEAEIIETLSEKEKWNRFRAYTPSPGAWFLVNRRGSPVRVKISKAHFEENIFIVDEYIPENTKPLSRKSYEQWLTQ